MVTSDSKKGMQLAALRSGRPSDKDFLGYLEESKHNIRIIEIDEVLNLHEETTILLWGYLGNSSLFIRRNLERNNLHNYRTAIL